VYDTAGGDEIDRIDENLCMPNYSALDAGTYLLDDEFAALLSDAHNAANFLRIFVILDACHSGTGTREVVFHKQWHEVESELLQAFGSRDPLASGFKMKANLAIPEIDLVVQPSISREAADPPSLDLGAQPNPSTIPVGQIGGNDPVSHLLLSGCDAKQTCKDVPINGEYHGIFTKTLTEALRLQPNATWQQVQAVVKDVISNDFKQSPQLEGPAAIQ
jgi:hypothetical protein